MGRLNEDEKHLAIWALGVTVRVTLGVLSSAFTVYVGTQVLRWIGVVP